MKITAEPRSDQWNADDFVGGPKTFTIAGIKTGAAEQKYDIELVEGEGRVWRPPLSMLRVLLQAWGDDSKAWVGRRVTLFRDPEISFGRDKVGGIRISHLSDIPKPLRIALTVSRGKRAAFTVDPLVESAPAPAITAEQVAASSSIDDLRALYQSASPDVQALILTRVEQLKTVPDENPA